MESEEGGDDEVNGGSGHPMLTGYDIDTCRYTFVWKTRYACS